jgi:hypothetical protein
MEEIPRTRTYAAIIFLLAASTLGSVGIAQDRDLCNGIGFIGAAPGKPFSAQGVTKRVLRSPDGTELETTDSVEYVARDSFGRIRLEPRSFVVTNTDAGKAAFHAPETGTIPDREETVGTSISIYDFPTGKMVWLQPSRQVASVIETCVSPQWGLHPYSFFATVTTPPGEMLEDLGYKEIEGLRAHGFKNTRPAIEPDGKQRGNPLVVRETWVSDDLAVVLLMILRVNKSESTTRFTDIKREEPDPLLFKVPSDYAIKDSANSRQAQ